MISLQKGQRVSLDSRIKLALIGLGWSENEYSGADFDLDATAFLLTYNKKVGSDEDFVFYGNQCHRSGSVKSSGDDTTGGSGGDCEQLIIDFDKIPNYVESIAICVSIYDAENRRQNFGQISDAYIRVAKINYEGDRGEEVIKYDLNEDFSTETAIIVCEIYRSGNEWKFAAVGNGVRGGLEALCHKYGINV